MNRRMFLKTATAAGMIPFLQSIILLKGCDEDKIVDALKVAKQVAESAAAIIAVEDTSAQQVLLKVASDLGVVIKSYDDYEVALDPSKPAIGRVIKAIADTIASNLSAILDAAAIKNKDKIQYISIAVAIVNSALTIVLSNIKTGGAPTSMAAARAAAPTPNLPLVDGAKSAKDLKSAWNNAVGKAFPQHKI